MKRRGFFAALLGAPMAAKSNQPLGRKLSPDTQMEIYRALVAHAHGMLNYVQHSLKRSGMTPLTRQSSCAAALQDHRRLA
jgi:hypothetical protein